MKELNVPPHVSPDRVYDFDMYQDPRLMKDLHEGFAQVMREAPEPFYTPLNGGHWVVTRLAHAEVIVREYGHFSTTESEIPRVKNPQSFIPLHYDPPRATPFRQALMPFFSPKAMGPLENKIRSWAGHFIDAVKDRGRCEFVADISSRIPVTVIMEMMGMPFDKFERFRALVEKFFSDLPEEQHYEINAAIYAEMDELIDARMRHKTGDVLSSLVDAQIDGRPIARDELRSMYFLLYLAGLDTVVNVLSFTYRELARLPRIQERLRSRPQDIPSFVEEGLRLFGVVNVPRVVIKDCDMLGVKFRTGDMVLTLLSQFGRDERENPHALEIDLERKQRRMAPFSTGPHLCVGHHLARTEMRIITEEWLKRIPSFRAAPGHRPSFRAGMVMALSDLPLEWDVA
jgi:cytochrome P450